MSKVRVDTLSTLDDQFHVDVLDLIHAREYIGEIQSQGSSTWSLLNAPYPVNAQVFWDNKQWIALRANSVPPAEGEDWSAIKLTATLDVGTTRNTVTAGDDQRVVGAFQRDNVKQVEGESTTDVMSQKASTDNFGQPTMTSDAVLVHTDNSIAATGIVSKLGLEVGDVIEVDNDDLRSGYLKPLGQTAGAVYQLATNGNDVYAVNYSGKIIMKRTNGEGLFEKIEGVTALDWIGICFIGNQMYAANYLGRIYSVNEATGVAEIASPTNRNWRNLTTDGTYIYAGEELTGIIHKIDPITKTEVAVVPTLTFSNVQGLVYSPIDNSLYAGTGTGSQPIRKLVNMTGVWIDVSTEKRPWSGASYYNGKVYFSDFDGQVWKENDAGDDFELFSKKPVGGTAVRGGNIIVNDILYRALFDKDIYTTTIIKKDLFTVESIVSDDKIIVNYAHAFGAGTKSLWNQTLSAAKFKRIAKWYNAPIGLGQAWANFPVPNGTYWTNTNQRPVMLLQASTVSIYTTVKLVGLPEILIAQATSADIVENSMILGTGDACKSTKVSSCYLLV